MSNQIQEVLQANKILNEKLTDLSEKFERVYKRQTELEEIIDGIARMFVEHTATLDERMNEQIEIFKRRMTNYVNNGKQ